jgi:peptidoglycan L-alanyl-D-glutamate endopeptidase CwlK
MRKWSNSSKQRLDTCTEDLQWLMNVVLQEVADISILKGHRDEAEQNEAFSTGHSKLRWPHGKHNQLPSRAVDFAPWPYPKRKEKLWAALAYVAGRTIELGRQGGLKVRWGGDWDGDGDLTDQNFDDLFHIEVSRADNYDSHGCKFFREGHDYRE